MKIKTLIITSICTTLAAGGIMQSAFGHIGATGIVKERMDDMVSMGKALGAVADILKGKHSFDAAMVLKSADTIIMHSKELGSLFPDTKVSRSSSHTEALSAVWDKNDDFLALAKLLEEKAGTLKTVAAIDTGNKLKVAFVQTAKVCSTCHADFRKKKD